MENEKEFAQINEIYDECLLYLKTLKEESLNDEEPLIDCENNKEPNYETIEEISTRKCKSYVNSLNNNSRNKNVNELKYENEINKKRREEFDKFKGTSNDSVNSTGELRSERLRRLSEQLPRIIITHSNTSLVNEKENTVIKELPRKSVLKKSSTANKRTEPRFRYKAYGDFPKRLVSKCGLKNVALISNVPFEKIRLLNDTFHTLITLRWRWIVIGTVMVHFAMWLVFAVFWYITALAHYDFDPDPPKRTCITGGKDFVTIFLASVEAQTTIGFGDRAIDEECPESIFLFVMQLILGTGLSGVLTCVVYAKLTRPEKLSRDGVGFSKKAVVCMRDGNLCLMIRAWDLNYDHIISSVFTAHFINTFRTKEGEVIRYYARTLQLQQQQFLLWPVTLVHVIDASSPLYRLTPGNMTDNSYEITISLKGASASMGTFTQSQTSYMAREVVWGHRFPPVVKYDIQKQKYVIEHSKLNTIEPVDTPHCSAYQLYRSEIPKEDTVVPGTPGSFSERVSTFQVQRMSSFKRK